MCIHGEVSAALSPYNAITEEEIRQSGIDPEQSIGKFLGDPPMRYNSAKGPCKLEGCLFDIDPETGRCRRAEAIRLI